MGAERKKKTQRKEGIKQTSLVLIFFARVSTLSKNTRSPISGTWVLGVSVLVNRNEAEATRPAARYNLAANGFFAEKLMSKLLSGIGNADRGFRLRSTGVMAWQPGTPSQSV